MSLRVSLHQNRPTFPSGYLPSASLIGWCIDLLIGGLDWFDWIDLLVWLIEPTRNKSTYQSANRLRNQSSNNSTNQWTNASIRFIYRSIYLKWKKLTWSSYGGSKCAHIPIQLNLEYSVWWFFAIAILVSEFYADFMHVIQLSYYSSCDLLSSDTRALTGIPSWTSDLAGLVEQTSNCCTRNSTFKQLISFAAHHACAV